MKKYILLVLSVLAFTSAYPQRLPPIHHAPNREFHTINIKLNLKFDMKTRTLNGIATETITPLRTDMDSLHLNAVDMSIEKVTMDRRKLDYRYDGKILTIILPRTYGLNSHFTYSVVYSTQPTIGIFFITPDSGYPKRNPEVWSMSEPEDARYWFPCHDYPDDFSSSEVVTTVPSNWTVISNGILKKVTPIDGGKEKIFDWVERRPHVDYLISVIAGVFDKFETHYGKVPIYFYADPKYGNLIARNFAIEPKVLQFYSTFTGQPFPWEKQALTCVTNFTWGGEENVSAITLTDRTIHDANAEPQVSSVSLIAHETAHQWFGDFLTTRNWANAWLNEGFATYFEAMFREHEYGEHEFQYEMYQNHNQTIAADNRSRESTVSRSYYDPVDRFDAYIYPRGASVLHMIRFVIGKPLFQKAIHYYIERYKGLPVGTHDLLEAIRQSTGYNLRWLFKELLYDAGHPVFDVSYKYHPDAGDIVMHVEQVQKVDSLTPVYKMPVDIYVVTPSEKFARRVWIDSLTNTYTFNVPDKPLMVNFDEGHWLLDEVHFHKSEEELAYQLKSDSDVVGRIWAANQLKKVYDSQAEDALISSLKNDSFWAVRSDCASLLNGYKDKNAEEALIAATNDLDARVQQAAIVSLGQFKNDDRVEALLSRIFYGRTNYFVRAAAVTAFSDVDSIKALHVIYTALDRDSYGNVIRIAALNALMKARPDMAFTIAANYSKYGEPYELRTEGVRVLADLHLHPRQTISLLSKYVSDPYIWVRFSALAGLARVGNKSVIPLLKERMKVESDGRLVQMAKRAIESIDKRDK